ncbi:hypothetical protein TNCV_1640201 [Trichonephila clavipes]|nr:hypothetical protein TNCV_1640201 [Trichonephila clavipes]
MFPSSSFVNPTPLAHADTQRDNHPMGGLSQPYLRIFMASQDRLKARRFVPVPRASPHSRLRLNKMITRIISTVKCFFRLRSPKNWTFQTLCQLATCDDCRPCFSLGLPPYAIITPSVKSYIETHTSHTESDCQATRGVLNAMQNLKGLLLPSPERANIGSAGLIYCRRKGVRSKICGGEGWGSSTHVKVDGYRDSVPLTRGYPEIRHSDDRR